MSEVEWSEESEEAPQKKRRIPKWVWIGCGGGCLVALILIVVLAIIGGMWVKNMADPEYAWPKVEQILPHDERPEGYTPRGGGLFGREAYIVIVEGLDGVFMVQRFGTNEELDQQFDPDSPANKGLFGLGEISNTEVGTMEIQGRETRFMRFNAWVPESAKEDGQVSGASIRVDVTGNGSIPCQIQITIEGQEDKIPVETVCGLLEPFDVWRGK